MSKSFNLFTILALLAALLGGAMTYTPARAAGVLFAKPDATGSGDCSSWANACTLLLAIDNAVSGDQIWVLAGTHLPPIPSRTVSFTLKNGVAIYGGFAVTDTQLSQRDPNPATNGTILSGDIGTPNDPSDNLYHVVTASNVNSSTILDGFTVRGGNANGSSPHNVGGGVFNNISSATLSNLIFSGNSSVGGGGAMYNQDGSNLKLTNVIFSENSSNYGGGINNFSSSPTLKNVIFSGNSASNSGGGISNYNSNPTLTNVTFSGNSASNNGGGINNNISNPTLTKVTFLQNSANIGGGIYNLSSHPTLTNVTFSKNSASHGGGIFNDGNSHPTLTTATFIANTAPSGNGGAVTNVDSSPILTNVTFSGNSAGNLGGGMYTLNGSPPLKNVTFSGNSAGSGGGMRYDSSNVILVNVIIANSTGGGDCVSSSTLSVAASVNNLIESASPSSACGLTNGGPKGNILGLDPRLAALQNNGGVTKTIALKNGSPAIDNGNDANCPAKDQRGKPRPQRDHCDIGAYEALYISGELDTTFSLDGQIITSVTPSWPQGEYATSIAIQADGKLVVTGRSNDDFALVRYNPNGTLDTTFSGDGKLTTDFGGVEIAYGVAVQLDGKIVAVGNKCSGDVCDLALARYTPTGNLDSAFDGDGKVLKDVGAKDNGGTSLVVLGNGKILVGGYVTRADRDPAVYRFNANGSSDAAFSGDGVAMGNFGPGDYISDLAVQSDGKIVLAGYTADGSGNNNFALTRLNANGTADLPFGVNSKQKTNFGGDDTAYSLALAGGAILVVGETCAATCSVAMARYTTTGDLDTTFSGDGKLTFKFGAGPLSSARSVSVVAGGKIVVAGAASGNFGLARLLPGGGFDPTFSGDGRVLIEFGGDDDANAIARQGNGRYVLGGFTNLGGDFALTRVLP